MRFADRGFLPSRLCIALEGPTPPGVAHSNFLLTLGLYPVFVVIPSESHYKLAPSLWSGLIEQHKVKSLRTLAREYGVSHEAVRRTLEAAKLY